jgi:hypothetical protein
MALAPVVSLADVSNSQYTGLTGRRRRIPAQSLILSQMPAYRQSVADRAANIVKEEDITAENTRFEKNLAQQEKGLAQSSDIAAREAAQARENLEEQKKQGNLATEIATGALGLTAYNTLKDTALGKAIGKGVDTVTEPITAPIKQYITDPVTGAVKEYITEPAKKAAGEAWDTLANTEVGQKIGSLKDAAAEALGLSKPAEVPFTIKPGLAPGLEVPANLTPGAAPAAATPGISTGAPFVADTSLAVETPAILAPGVPTFAAPAVSTATPSVVAGGAPTFAVDTTLAPAAVSPGVAPVTGASLYPTVAGAAEEGGLVGVTTGTETLGSTGVFGTAATEGSAAAGGGGAAGGGLSLAEVAPYAGYAAAVYAAAELAKNLNEVKEVPKEIPQAGQFVEQAVSAVLQDPTKIITKPVEFIGQIAESINPFCFVAGTPVLMADKTTRPVETLTIGDEVFGGGQVLGSGVVLTLYIYEYKGIQVEGQHAVFEDGRWVRVEHSYHAVPTEDLDEPVRVYPVITKEHLMIVNGIIFADLCETDQGPMASDIERMHTLNSDEMRNAYLKDMENELSKIR